MSGDNVSTRLPTVKPWCLEKIVEWLNNHWEEVAIDENQETDYLCVDEFDRNLFGQMSMELPCHFVNSWLRNPTIEAVAMFELALLTYPSLKILAPPAEYQLAIGQKIIVIAHNTNRLCHRAIAGEYRGFQQGCHVLDTTDYRHLREFPKRSVPRNIVHFWPSSPPELAFDFHENYLLIVSEK